MSSPFNLVSIKGIEFTALYNNRKKLLNKFRTSLSGLSPLNKDVTAPVNATAVTAPTRPIPAHKSHPFCRLNGSLQSETVVANINSKNHIL